MEVIATCIHQSQKRYNISITQVLKSWNVLPTTLRNLSDPKAFNKVYKAQLLEAITNDNRYKNNNAYDFFYKVPD